MDKMHRQSINPGGVECNLYVFPTIHDIRPLRGRFGFLLWGASPWVSPTANDIVPLRGSGPIQLQFDLQKSPRVLNGLIGKSRKPQINAIYFDAQFHRRFSMRRFILSVIACLAVVLLMARAVDPVPVAAHPAGAASAVPDPAAADFLAPLVKILPVFG